MLNSKTKVIYVALFVAATLAWAGQVIAQNDLASLKESMEELEERLMSVERHSAIDRLNINGDFRFEAHSIDASIPSHFNGMALQNSLFNTLFFYQGTGRFPMGGAEVGNFVNSNFGDYLAFQNNMTFEQLKQAVQQMPPEQRQQLFSMLMPGAYTKGYDADNDISYTSRLRLNMKADVADNITFSGRLGMYKSWGDSTGVQVFNGQPTSINTDGTTVGVPNSDILRVERAYFTWTDLFDSPAYLSIGRRPSTGGAPMHLRKDDMRGGSPLGSLIDYQFDGITVGYHLSDQSTVRLCYGMGYDSGFGQDDELHAENDLNDAQFLGINWDLFSNENTLLQTTVARAMEVTDGFNGLVVMNTDPVTGITYDYNSVMRYTPSDNLGDIDLAGILLLRKDGPFDWFASLNYMRSDPNDVTTPFGGLFCDPYEVPDEEDGYMVYVGGRYTLPNNKTKIGLEYNHGSEYWFNFAHAEDDIIGAKTATRGDVWEAYVAHRPYKRMTVKLSYTHYLYDYSGSGWHVGAPQDLDDDPILGYATYDEASVITLSMMARF